MECSAWKNGNISSPTYGIRVGISNRDLYFNVNWNIIEVEIDGINYKFELTPGFWKDCPEFRDKGSIVIQEWLKKNHTLSWPYRQPPHMHLIPVNGNQFRLI